ncbi:hypothetical protein, partial [Vibrio vulnificus]|uniref:hypothetical protein n=1 Tax=Vibrio vulnificus TaxID=672 RepID=UPI003EDA649F
ETNTAQTIRVLNNSLILIPELEKQYNAALRGECRTNRLPAGHFHHQNSLQTKNATRHESHLNALLCLSLKGLSLRYQELNSTYLCKPKADAKKLN